MQISHESSALVFFGRDSKADGVPLQRDGAVADDSVKAQSRDMQHILRLQLHLLTVLVRIGVDEIPLAVPINIHMIRQKWV